MLEAPLPVAHALCVYAEPLAARRRVAVVGDSSLGLDARLIELGARTVHVYDPDGSRAREYAPRAARGVVVRELPAGEFDVREGAYDLAIVTDLGKIDDRASLLLRVRKLVGPEGAALIAARNAGDDEGARPGGLDYYEMYDLVALQFASVRMIGQIPFAGVALAELGESEAEPQVTVDTQLLGGENEAPEVYVALAAQRDVRLDAFAIVQLPRQPSPTPASPPGPSPSEHAALAAALLRADLAESQLEEQRAVISRLTVASERGGRVAELEAALQERTAKLKEAETRAGDHYVRAERLTHDLRRLEEELSRQRDIAVRLARSVEEEKQARVRAAADLRGPELAEARQRTALLEEGLRAAEEAVNVLQQRVVEGDEAIALRDAQIALLAGELSQVKVIVAQVPMVAPHVVAELTARAEHAEGRAALLDAQIVQLAEAEGRELAELERLLRERAQAISGLEQEVVRRERMVRELLAALEDAQSAAPGEAAAEPSALAAAGDAVVELRRELDRIRAENGELRKKLDALALDVARREGELQARGWRISELEEKVASLQARLPAPSGEISEEGEREKREGEEGARDVEPLEPLEPLRAELSALRQALAQEHAARVSAESGEDLTRARADLARQAVLLEQLAGELARYRERGAQDEEGAGQPPGPAQT
jgi:hypothetical protein